LASKQTNDTVQCHQPLTLWFDLVFIIINIIIFIMEQHRCRISFSQELMERLGQVEGNDPEDSTSANVLCL